MSEAPLQGVRVLDLSTVGPAARCARILADYGATVVKVGAPGKGAQRPHSAPQASEPQPVRKQVQPAWWAYAAGRGMQSLRIDLKAPEGRDAFLVLAAAADAVLESFRPGVVARLGIGWDEVRRVNPAIVYCSTSGYGQAGPAARWAGHDLDYLAVAGFLACTGRRADGGPALPGATVADAAAGGMHAAIAILSALFRSRATGEGAHLDVSVADGVLQLMSLQVDEHLATGAAVGPGRSLLTGRYACYDVYPARDGRWLAVAAIEPAFWANLCRAVGCERWIEHQLDDDRQEEIRTDLRRAFATRDRDAWVEALAPADTCVAPVLEVDEVVESALFTERGAFVEVEHPEHGRFRQVAPVLAGMPRSAPPALAGGSDAEALLREAGLPAERIASLRRQGVVT